MLIITPRKNHSTLNADDETLVEIGSAAKCFVFLYTM